MEREKLIDGLLKLFSAALTITLKPFEKVSEKIDYLEALINYTSGVYHHQDAIPSEGVQGNPFDREGFIRKNILAKYRDKAKPFVENNLHLFLEKNPEDRTYLFQGLKINEPILNEQEFKIYIETINGILQNLIEKALIETSAEDDSDLGNETVDSNGYSRSRQVLMLYYLLQITRLGRDTNSISKITEFAHALFNIPTKNFNTSALQKMFKSAPMLKINEVNMIQDLEFVKTKFLLLGSSDAVTLIQKEIDHLSRRKP